MKLRNIFTIFCLPVINAWLVISNITTINLAKSPNGDCPTAIVPEMIENAGYQSKLYNFVTKDGYNLTEIRILGGRKGFKGIPRFKSKNYSTVEDGKQRRSNVSKQGKECSKLPVLLVHGLMGDSSNWIMHDFDKATAYVLADNGYDVWLHNTRGTKYSQTHTELNKTQSEFWSYSFVEMGKFDIPAAIDGIIETTGCKKIFYVGHSLGTTQFFASMSLQPEQNKKIIAMFALAPVAYLSNIKSLIGLAAKLSTLLRIETELFGHFEVGSDSQTVNKLMSYICTSSEIRKEMCQNLMFLISGNGKEQFNEPWYSTFVGHVPAPTSSKTLIHLAQGIQSKRFALYDYGWKNYAKYMKFKSPDINLKLVTAPVHLFNSENDLLSVVADVQKLREELPNVQLYTIPYEKWNHLDFILGKEINKYINIPLLRQMKGYEKQLPVQN